MTYVGGSPVNSRQDLHSSMGTKGVELVNTT